MNSFPLIVPLLLSMPAQDLAKSDQAAQSVAANKPARLIETSPDSAGAMSMWLVNLARHQGHLVGRSDPRAASLHVLALLEAAAEVSPDCADAQYWLYDLRHRMGHADKALEALANYVRLAPGDETARIRLLDLRLEEAQTSEKRLNILLAELKSAPLSPTVESELHARMARHHHERRETEQAGKELEDALRLNPMNIAARELSFEIFGETEPALQRVDLALQLISGNPTQANLLWELGEYLDTLSLHRQAQEWYNRAIDLHRGGDKTPIPAEYWHRLGVSYISSKDYAKAKEAATAALEVDPSCQLARMLRANAEGKLGEAKAAAADLDIVKKEYAQRRAEVIEKKDRSAAAEMAWFYAFHQPDKEWALKLAQVAVDEKEPSGLARLAYGYALRMNGRSDEAVKTLMQLATTDQMAALELSKIEADKSGRAAVKPLLHKAASIHLSGIAYEMIREQLRQMGEQTAEPPLQTKVVTTLEKFPRDVFDFHKRPGEFLKFSVRPAGGVMRPLGPLNVVLRMENVGPFPISMGDGFMVRPLVALSAQVGDQGAITFKDYLQVLLNARPVLAPGDVVEKTIAVDVGHLREYVLRNATSNANLTLTALLDPVFKDGELQRGPGTIAPPPLVIARKGLDTSAESVQALMKSAKDAGVFERMSAAEAIAALLVFADKQQVKAASSKLPVEALRMALCGLLTDAAWQVRAVALVGAAWSPMDPRITQAAAPSIQSNESIIKLLAVRLFAPQHGDKFRAVLEKLSKTDPSHFVRMMALSYLPEPVRASASVSPTHPAADSAP